MPYDGHEEETENMEAEAETEQMQDIFLPSEQPANNERFDTKDMLNTHDDENDSSDGQMSLF